MRSKCGPPHCKHVGWHVHEECAHSLSSHDLRFDVCAADKHQHQYEEFPFRNPFFLNSALLSSEIDWLLALTVAVVAMFSLFVALRTNCAKQHKLCNAMRRHWCFLRRNERLCVYGVELLAYRIIELVYMEMRRRDCAMLLVIIEVGTTWWTCFVCVFLISTSILSISMRTVW